MPDDVMTDTDLPVHAIPDRTAPGATEKDVVIGAQVTDDSRQEDDPARVVTRDNRRSLEDREATAIAAANRARDDAIRQRDEALTTNLQAQRGAVEQGLRTEQALYDAAIIAKKTAREANDVDAEIKADRDLQARAYNLNVLNGRKQALERTPPPQQQQNDGVSQEAQRWIDDHPLFNTDEDYHADAIAAHTLAVNKGLDPNTRGYVEYIDQRMEKLYGKDHGRMTKEPQRREAPIRQRSRQEPDQNDQSYASPRSNDRGGRGSSLEYKHGTGSIRLIERRDPSTGKVREGVEGKVPAAWVDGAKVCGMDLEAYAVEQMKIQQEMRSGNLRGLAVNQSGVYE